jgi:flagellar hook-length control protein FliK
VVIDFIAQASFDAEPIAAQSAVKEQPQDQENYQCSFEELLAGALHADISAGKFSNIEIADDAVLPVENAEIDKLERLGVLTPDVLGIDLDNALSEEDKNILLNPEHFFISSLEISSELDGSEALLPETPDAKIDHLAELKSQSDLSLAVKKPAEPDTAVQLSASEKQSLFAGSNREEALGAEMTVKKNRATGENQSTEILSKNQNTEIHPSMIKAGEENGFSHNKEERGKLDEMRNLSRHDRLARSDGTLEIHDQRSAADAHNRTQSVMSMESMATRVTDASAQEIMLELRLPDFNNAGQSAQTTWEGKSANALENMLARELHQNFNGDIVRHASMALRNGGESTIKLVLRPETLGNVKIRLEMTENKITGYIIVESEEALNAFRKEITSLEQAFKEAGFADASLNLSLTADDGNMWQDFEKDSFSSQMVASNYENSLLDAELDITALIDVYGNGSGRVNMLA